MKNGWQKIAILIWIIFFIWLVGPGEIRANDYALDFDGSDDYVEILDSSTLDFGTGDFTIEAWLFPNQDGDAADGVGKYSGSIDNGFLLGVDFISDGFWFYVADSPEKGSGMVQYISMPNHQAWHHVVGVVNGTNILIYVDGELKDEGVFPGADINNGESLTFGKMVWQGNYAGLIDEVRLYSRALSATEISEHYNGTFNNETGLAGLWRFDEGVGNIAADSSGQGNNGTVLGAIWMEGRLFDYPARPVELGQAFQPMIEIESPKTGDLFSENVVIKYKASDENDTAGPAQFGLGNDAVSVFYSDNKGKSWKLLADALPPVGSYLWDLKNLSEGDFYKIKVAVQDKSGEKNESILERLVVDKTPPLFDVSVEPSFSKGENVRIKIQATEPLLESPEVIVRQRNYIDIKVPVLGKDAFWEGEYEVKKGYDGTAKIMVKGKDKAGNLSDIIRQGGLFHIGVIPPPLPIITSPLDNDVVDSPFISVIGNVREDTKALLFLNNEKITEVKPDKEGNFRVENIELSKIFNKGVNILKIISEDKGGNLSQPLTLSIKFNLPPDLEILAPREKTILFSTSAIEFLAKDENGDKLAFSIEVSYDEGKSWQRLADNLSEQIFVWDTRDFPDGEYLLKVKVSDGFKEIERITDKFLLRNFLPVISFEKEKTITNTGSAEINGAAELRLRGYEREKKNIIGVEYSIDDGKSWIAAFPKDGIFDGLAEEFTIRLSGLNEAIYEVLTRAKDSKELIGKNKTILIVDFGPPLPPNIIFPKDKSVFGKREDLNPEKAGIQIKIGGTAEPNNQIVVLNGNLTFEGSSDDNGNFEMEISLREHGENILKLRALDPAGNKSEKETIILAIKNEPPDLKILWPRIGGGINHSAEIIFEIKDSDLDQIKESGLSYRKFGQKIEVLLAQNLKGNKFSFDANNLQEGLYELLLEATDGISENAIIQEFFIDNTLPEVSFEPLEKIAFAKKFILEMEGEARDNFSGIEYVEYSINSDSGEISENWFKSLITDGYKSKTAGFRLKHPFLLEDGIYYVSFRATDVSGNVSKASEGQKIIIDTTAPRIGSYTLSSGMLILFPEDDFFKIPAKTAAKFIISLEEDTQKAVLFFANQEIELVKKLGLWEGEIVFSDAGESKILISAEDRLGNKTEQKEIGRVKVISKGKVLSPVEKPLESVKMTVFVFNEKSQSWVEWQGETYDLSNPIFTDRNGEYNLLLPPGKYQILLEKTGFKRQRTSAFEVLNPHFINFDFKLEPRRGLRGLFEDVLEKITF